MKLSISLFGREIFVRFQNHWTELFLVSIFFSLFFFFIPTALLFNLGFTLCEQWAELFIRDDSQHQSSVMNGNYRNSIGIQSSSFALQHSFLWARFWFEFEELRKRHTNSHSFSSLLFSWKSIFWSKTSHRFLQFTIDLNIFSTAKRAKWSQLRKVINLRKRRNWWNLQEWKVSLIVRKESVKWEEWDWVNIIKFSSIFLSSSCWTFSEKASIS